MELQPDLKKPIEEIKNPILRGWIICLVIAVTGLSSAVIYLAVGKDKDKDQEIIKKDQEISRLNNKIEWQQAQINYKDSMALSAGEEDKKRLLRRIAVFDSIINLGRSINK